MKKYLLTVISSTLAIVAIVLWFGVQTANANPSVIVETKSASASTTVAYIVPGTATTTLYYDSQANFMMPDDSQVLLVQFTGSSTVTTLQINQEYAQGSPSVDCTVTPSACDWYEGTQGTIVNGSIATTSSSINGNVITTFDIASVPQYSFKFASSTIGGVAQGSISSTTPINRLIPFTAPTRYIRFVFSLKIVANGNGAVWAEVVSKKQNR